MKLYFVSFLVRLISPTPYLFPDLSISGHLFNFLPPFTTRAELSSKSKVNTDKYCMSTEVSVASKIYIRSFAWHTLILNFQVPSAILHTSQKCYYYFCNRRYDNHIHVFSILFVIAIIYCNPIIHGIKEK